MTQRPSLGFNDDEALERAVPSPLELSAFKPKAVLRPDPEQIAKAAASAQFRSREAKAPAAPSAPELATVRPVRRHRTGRTAQLNLKARPETIERFCAVADERGWLLSEAFEMAVSLLENQPK